MNEVSSTKSINKISSHVTGMTCVVWLNGARNDESTMSFMVTNEHKQIYYLTFVDCPLKGRECTSCDVFVVLPAIPVDRIVNPKKSNQFKLNWNEKLNNPTVLHSRA